MTGATQAAKVCFITMFPPVEARVAARLEEAGVATCHIAVDGHWHQWLKDQGVPSGSILAVDRFPTEFLDAARRSEVLAEVQKVEAKAGLGFHEACLMDRAAREHGAVESEAYACMFWTSIRRFLHEQEVTHVVCEPTSLTELVAYLCCRDLGIQFLAPRFCRFPADRLMFFGDPYHREPLPVPGPSPRPSGDDVLRGFQASRPGPAMYFSPLHAKTFSTGRALWALKDQAKRRRHWTRSSWNYVPLSRMASAHAARAVRSWTMARFSGHARPEELKQGRAALFALHVQPESAVDVDGSYHSDQLHVIRCLRKALPADMVLYVKEHAQFTGLKRMSFFRDVLSIPGVRLLDHRVRASSLFDDLDLILTISGTVAFEGGMAGIPTVLLVPMYFDGLSTITVCGDLRRLPAAIREVLARRQDVAKDAAVLDRLLAVSHPGNWCDDLMDPSASGPENVANVTAAILRAIAATSGAKV